MSATANPVVVGGVPASGTRKEWPPNGELSMWIQSQFPAGYTGYAVDVGASDGISVNSTYMLEQWRWTVLSIEPNPIFWPRLKQLRAFVQTCACDAESVETMTFHSFDHNPESYSALRPTYPDDFPPHLGWTRFPVPVKTLEQCLTEAQFPCLDVVCIDTEGTEVDVLRGLDIKEWRPKVMVIESWDESGKAVQDYLRPFGYKRIGRHVHNELLVLEPTDDDRAQPVPTTDPQHP